METPKGLSRKFVVESILKILDGAEARKEWGSVLVSYKAGVVQTIRKEETITEER
jgi:hypothetical protein